MFDKYTVARNDGKQTPESRYFVLDYVRDLEARAAARMYIMQTPNEELARSLTSELEQTEDAALAHALTHRTIPAESTSLYWLDTAIEKAEATGAVAYSNDANVYYKPS